ncbi:hypothetical protein WJX79_001827, partial [Trebouxia sp. C0005]
MISGSKAQNSKESGPVWGPFDDSERYGGYVPQRQYFRDSFMGSRASLHQREYFNRFMASLIGETACGDHFHKPSKLVRLQGKGIQHFWADDPPVCAPFLHNIWADLQTVKDDLFHWLDRINRTIPAGHPLKRLFAAAMAKAVFSEVNVADLKLLRAALEAEDRYSKEQIEAFLNTGKVQQGWLSDPLPPDQMYYAVPVSKNQIRWIAVHGSSKLEGYHRWMNAQLSSGNTSPALAGALMCHRNGRWNIDCEIKNNKGTDYGMYDLSLVEEKSRMYRQLQMPNPYSDFKVLEPTKEKFGYDWDPSTEHAVLQVEDAQAVAPGPVEGQDQIFELMQGGSEDPLVEGPTMAAAKAIMADPAKREAEQLAVQARIAQVKETWREISGVAGASLPQAGPSASSAKICNPEDVAGPSRDWTAGEDANPEDVAGSSRDWTVDEDVNPEFLAELDRLEMEHSTGRRKQQGCPSSNAPPAETPLASAAAPPPRAQ